MTTFATGVVLSLIYFFPTIIAAARNRQVASILTLNLLLGWTLIGWIICLVWSLSDRSGDTTKSDREDVTEEIRKLHQLKEEGILTEEEFQHKKKRLL